eukprot:TRINITY_DN16213_c0_g1_i1.p1 TRINITY_DN16213_c0_g1~~TRINITY_DN16213_c0_g1_i1.p1  ORF type:complete len:176 (+),score=6.11 TRINITY_DN16213_c0_g1_i1:423-950(+)
MMVVFFLILFLPSLLLFFLCVLSYIMMCSRKTLPTPSKKSQISLRLFESRSSNLKDDNEGLGWRGICSRTPELLANNTSSEVTTATESMLAATILPSSGSRLFEVDPKGTSDADLLRLLRSPHCSAHSGRGCAVPEEQKADETTDEGDPEDGVAGSRFKSAVFLSQAGCNDAVPN